MASVEAEAVPSMPVEVAEGEYTLSLRDVLRTIRRRVWVVLLVAALCVGTAVGLSLLQTPMYESSIKILVGQEQGSNISNNLGSDVQGLQQLTETMNEAVNSRPIAAAVVQQLDLQMTPEDFLEKHLRAEVVPRTQFIEVTYEDSSPERAQRVANAVGEEFSKQVSEASPSANAIAATVWERAEVPDKPVSPNFLRTGLLALVLGLMLGLGIAFLLEYLDDSWRSPEEAEQISGVPTLGVIPVFSTTKAKKKEGY